MKTHPRHLIAGLVLLAGAGFLQAHTPSATPVKHQHLLFKKATVKNVLIDEDDNAEVRVSREIVPPTAGTVPEPGVVTYVYTIERNTAFDQVYSLLTLGIQAIDWDVTIDSCNSADATADPAQIEVGLVKGESATVDKLVPGIEVPRTDKIWSKKNKRYVPIEDNIWLIKLVGAKSFTLTVTTVNRPKTGFTKWDNGVPRNGHDNTPPI